MQRGFFGLQKEENICSPIKGRREHKQFLVGRKKKKVLLLKLKGFYCGSVDNNNSRNTSFPALPPACHPTDPLIAEPVMQLRFVDWFVMTCPALSES